MAPSRLLYGSAVFLSALLLFLVEPLSAKQLLPVLGGSSAVWLTCLVFFQTTLLLGYLYAHTLTRIESNRRQQQIHLALIAAAATALAAASLIHPDLSRGTAHPFATIFLTLTVSIGLPFFLLASTTPLLQVWLFRGERTETWYRLFALSNAGSLLALLAYPTVIEPYLTLRMQRALWAAGFAGWVVLCVTIAVRRKGAADWPADAEIIAGPPASAAIRALWFLLPMAAAMQLSAVTAHLTSNIAAIPLLWILPLAAYLITFIIAFEASSVYRRGVVARLLIIMLAGLGYALSKTDFTLPVSISILFFVAECFFACLFCHAEVYDLRPRGASQTTLFYLMVASGGAAGTFLIGIASPLIFSANYDLAISFFAVAALALVVTWGDGWPQRLLWTTGTVLLLGLSVMLHTVYGRQTLLLERNFYGTLRVKQADSLPQTGPVRTLLNGTIQHGTQLFNPTYSRTPTTYYASDSGVGLALRFCCDGRPRRVGVIGLGAGTLAAYGRIGDTFRFYEINPMVRPIAENLFTYLRDSAAQISFAEGDARTSLAHEAPQGFDVLVIDAFSGDAIPLHLLTTQAMRLYQRHLAPGGVLAFHVSNQYLNLPPEIARLADAAGMKAKLVDSPDSEARGEFRASWVLVASDDALLSRPEVAWESSAIKPLPGLRVWTDDYSSLLPILQSGDR